jgi:hypothetical protein
MPVSDQAGSEPRDDDKPLDGPYWEVPWVYGEPGAAMTVGTVAAPLLAGFSLAAMVQTLTITSSDTRWPEAALLLFMLAAVLFMASIQFMIWARAYKVSPPEIMGWWPDAERPLRSKMLQQEQKRLAASFRMWSSRARALYTVALLCLLAALTMLAVPPANGQVPVLRWLAVGVGGTAFMVNAIWSLAMSSRTKWMARLLLPPTV